MSQTDTTNNKSSSTRENLALIVGGLFVLGIVFATYTYFNKGVDVDTTNQETSQSALDRLKEIIASNTSRENNTLPEEEKETAPVKPETLEKKDTTVVTKPATTPSAPAKITVSALNDYKLGDIKGGSYTVKAGDTLWEIAEGMYGNGAEWKKILSANSSSIGFLPNGRQALIVPGQVLVLP